MSSAEKGKLPFVSIVIPIFNERRHIESILDCASRQDYPRELIEVIIADGMSTDGTREIVERMRQQDSRLVLLDNPGRFVPTGLNRAIHAARGELIVRMDGHCDYPADYVRSVAGLLLSSGADNVGGVLIPSGRDYISRAVAAAYRSPLAVGVSMRASARSADIDEVDSVHGGCWRRERLIAAGGFDEAMVRNQDDELSFRLRKAGGRILQSGAIRCVYWVRNSFRRLFHQFLQYGYWKVRVIERHPRQASARHFVPATFIVTATVLATLSALDSRFAPFFGGLAGLYLTVILLESLHRALTTSFVLWPGIALALVCMQSGYGVGFLGGIVRKITGRAHLDAAFSTSSR